jgi:hypothetical protein
VAKRINYGFEKNKKEAKRKQKRDAKLEKKRISREGRQDGVVPTEEQPTVVDDAPTDASRSETTP